MIRKGKGSAGSTDASGSVGNDARLLLAALTAINDMGKTTSTGWLAYQSAQAALELCATPDDGGSNGTARRFYGWPDQSEALAGMTALVGALGDGQNGLLNPRIIDAIDALQATIYSAMAWYLDNADGVNGK